MTKLDSLKAEILDLLNKVSSERIEVKEAFIHFNELNHKLNTFYSELENILKEKPLEENTELNNFSLIHKTFLECLEAFVQKSSRYEINYSLMKFFSIKFLKLLSCY